MTFFQSKTEREILDNLFCKMKFEFLVIFLSKYKIFLSFFFFSLSTMNLQFCTYNTNILFYISSYAYTMIFLSKYCVLYEYFFYLFLCMRTSVTRRYVFFLFLEAFSSKATKFRKLQHFFFIIFSLISLLLLLLLELHEQNFYHILLRSIVSKTSFFQRARRKIYKRMTTTHIKIILQFLFIHIRCTRTV